jgi:hypothetical protein
MSKFAQKKNLVLVSQGTGESITERDRTGEDVRREARVKKSTIGVHQENFREEKPRAPRCVEMPYSSRINIED